MASVMRTEGSPAVLEYRRRLAVQRVGDGYPIGEVADFLGVDRRTVRRWVAAFHRHGASGLAAQPVPGRPPKLTSTQEKIVGRVRACGGARAGRSGTHAVGRRYD